MYYYYVYYPVAVYLCIYAGNFLSDSLTSDLLDRRSAGSLSDQDIITLLLQ